MNENEIISDIHRHREAVARSCGYDAKKLMDYYRRREQERPTAGHRLVSYAQPRDADSSAGVLREEPPKE